MTDVTCRLTAKNRDQLRNPTLGNVVWATFTFSNDTLSMDVCRDLIEEILSPEEDDDAGGVRFGGAGGGGRAASCCNSSHFSDNNKSEKNMSDFDGEDGVLSDEEIVTLSRSMAGGIHGHLCSADGMPLSPRRIPGVATIYPKHHLHGPLDSAQGRLPLCLFLLSTGPSICLFLYF